MKLEKLQKMFGPDTDRVVSFAHLMEDDTAEELEDFSPETYFLPAVAKDHCDVSFEFSSAEISVMPSVVDRCKTRIKAACRRFDRLAAIQHIVVDLHSRAQTVPPELMARSEKIFAGLNRLF